MVVRDLEISKVNPIWKIHQNPQEQWIIESVAAIGKPFLISKKRWPLFVPGGASVRKGKVQHDLERPKESVHKYSESEQ